MLRIIREINDTETIQMLSPGRCYVHFAVVGFELVLMQFFVAKSESFLLLLPKICEAFCSEMDQTDIKAAVVMQLAILLAGTEPSKALTC